MEKLSFIIFPYRGIHFKKKYGTTVRDLQIIEIIKNSELTENCLVVERPLSIYEILLGRMSKKPNHLTSISTEIIGPLKQRSWTEYCYDQEIQKINTITMHWKNVVILDFTPIAKININKIKHDYYWYDLIDNFSIHNRFNQSQKNKVLEKYSSVQKKHDLISGVSEKSLLNFETGKKIILPNGLYPDYLSATKESKKNDKYGFVGFITNKLDLEFLENLLSEDSNATIGIYGEILDSKVEKHLKSIKNINIYGKFHRRDYPSIFSSFKVGLIPYLLEKSHDGSALKLYDYLFNCKPVLTSTDYEMKNEFIINYKEKTLKAALTCINQILTSNDLKKIQESIPDDGFIEKKVEQAIRKIHSEFYNKKHIQTL